MPGLRARSSLALTLPLAAALVLFAPSSRADDLSVTTRELGGWNDALAALRSDLGSEGRRIHVAVLSGGSHVPCARYRIQLDEAAAQAFHVGGCDPGTGETLLLLEHRAALFDEGFHVPRPRTMAISAFLQTTAVATGSPEGGSMVRCSWTVQPYLDDQEHGTRVMLTPEHYALRSATASVTTTPDGAGWTMHATSATFDLEYEVTDRATGDVVLRQKTALTCGAAPRADEPRATPAAEPPLKPGTRVYLFSRWTQGEVLRPHGEGAYVVAVRSDYGLLTEEIVPRDRLMVEREPTPLPKDPGPVTETCRWGRTRKGRCEGSPAGLATMFTIMGVAATGAAAGAFYAASREPGGIRHSGIVIPASLATIGATIWSTAGIALWAQYARGMAKAPVQPAVAVSTRGGTFGIAGTF